MAQLTKEDNYAFAELLELLSFLDEESKNKIPKKLISIFEANALESYEKHLSPELSFEQQSLSDKTISYLGVIYLNYWCEDEEEKKELINKFRENDIRKEEELREKYSYDKMFNNQKSTEETSLINTIEPDHKQKSTTEISTSNLPVDYNNLPWFKKVFSKIRSFFNNLFKSKNPT